MRNKTKRLLAIRKLIENEQICSQEELLFRLKELNVEATQSTLSRDLKFMRVAKIPHKDKGYIYIIPDSIQNEQADEKASTIVTDAISSIDFSGNIAVMKTLPGYAKAVTVLIDNENYFEVTIQFLLSCGKALPITSYWMLSRLYTLIFIHYLNNHFEFSTFNFALYRK